MYQFISTSHLGAFGWFPNFGCYEHKVWPLSAYLSSLWDKRPGVWLPGPYRAASFFPLYKGVAPPSEVVPSWDLIVYGFHSLTSQESDLLGLTLLPGISPLWWELLLSEWSPGPHYSPSWAVPTCLACVPERLLVWALFPHVYMSAEVCRILSSKHTTDMGYVGPQLPLLVHSCYFKDDSRHLTGRWLSSYSARNFPGVD